MEKHLKYMTIKKIQQLGCGEICFLSLNGSGENNFPTHSKILNSISGVRIAGPEIYASDFHENYGETERSGEILIRGTNTTNGIYNGLQCISVPKPASKEIFLNGEKVGIEFEDEYARYAVLCGIFPCDTNKCKISQTINVFENIETALKGIGMDFSNVVRTWFYNDKILEWYEEFNRARDSFFESRNIFDGIVPASTAIGSRNSRGAALAARAFAVLPKSERVKIAESPSPMQCPASEYRSSFSRAMELSHPKFRHLIISGTAGIEYGGNTAFTGNLEKQMNLALDVVGAILKSRGMDWSHAVRAVAYLKEQAFLETFNNIKINRGLEELPCIAIQADICRDDLLFEMELDAVSQE